MRGVYADRREALRGALEETFGSRFPIVSGDGGLHLTLLLDGDVDDVALAERASGRGIDPQPLSAHCFSGTPRRGLVLGYGGFPPERLVAGVETLARCLARGTERVGEA